MDEELIMKDGTEVHIATIDDFFIGKTTVSFSTRGRTSFNLSLSDFKDKSYLKKITKGDQIIYMSNGTGVKKLFFTVYEMKFGIEED